jgi:hypothetical protein
VISFFVQKNVQCITYNIDKGSDFMGELYKGLFWVKDTKTFDAVVFLYREKYYNDNIRDDVMEFNVAKTETAIAKQYF